jgi:transposase
MRTPGSAAELEVRRRIAGHLLSQGLRVAEVARIVGASWSSVKRWKVAIETGGMKALAAKPHPGKPSRLNPRQKEKLVRLLEKGRLKCGFATDLWTCPRVAEVIERHFGVRYDDSHVWRILRQLGWTCHASQRRPREQDPAAPQRWRKRDWPRIKKGARKSS